MKTVSNPSNRDQKILVEQIKALYRLLPPIILASLAICFALVYGLWNVVTSTTLIAWLALMLFAYFIRLVTVFSFRRSFKELHVRRHAVYLIVGSALSGAAWGVGGVVLFPPQQFEYQMLILIVIISMGAGSVSTLTTYLPVFFAYLPISLLPIIIKLFLLGGPIYTTLGIMTLTYILALSYFAIFINRTLKQSLELRFENIDLVEQLLEQKDEADKANIAKSKFLAAASHDLRQPLHALSLFTSVLVETIKYPKVRRVVDQINASVDALQNLFNSLLDISQLDAGVMKVEKTDFHLAHLFKKMANDFDSQASEKNLRIQWPNVSYAVHSDPNLLERIVRNYISNAVRYTENGEIIINCKANAQSITISVTDTGCGIPDEEKQSIFSEFYQLSNPERDRGKGLGLGLAIVQRTANLLGHAIEIESQTGVGSTFSITVQQADNNIDNTSTISNEESVNISITDTLILVIDDEPNIREGMQNLLTLWGCEVITAADQKEALTIISHHDRNPDGIIADYRLRENQTGVDAIRAIHAKCKSNIPALIVTGDIAVERLREVNNSGFQLSHKPVAPIKLHTFLRHVQLHNKNTTVT
ncbi:MAG: response regulator [Gammaproteobacteria bacterium]|nr:response regulator [Gammaproteobacteria bacterium]